MGQCWCGCGRRRRQRRVRPEAGGRDGGKRQEEFGSIWLMARPLIGVATASAQETRPFTGVLHNSVSTWVGHGLRSFSASLAVAFQLCRLKPLDHAGAVQTQKYSPLRYFHQQFTLQNLHQSKIFKIMVATQTPGSGWRRCWIEAMVPAHTQLPIKLHSSAGH